MPLHGTAIDHQFGIKFPPPFGGIGQEAGELKCEMQGMHFKLQYFQHVTKYAKAGTNPALIRVEID